MLYKEILLFNNDMKRWDKIIPNSIKASLSNRTSDPEPYGIEINVEIILDYNRATAFSEAYLYSNDHDNYILTKFYLVGEDNVKIPVFVKSTHPVKAVHINSDTKCSYTICGIYGVVSIEFFDVFSERKESKILTNRFELLDFENE